MKSKDFEIRTQFSGVGDPSSASTSFVLYDTSHLWGILSLSENLERIHSYVYL